MTITETDVPAENTPTDGASLNVGTEFLEAETVESEPVEALFEVDGSPITADEAKNGYLRQADYTRKTQELAEQRRQLQNAEILQSALQRDPQATLRALADAYNVPLTTPTSQSASTPDEGFWGGDDDDAPATVNDPRLDDLVQWRQQQEFAAAQAQIKNELATLESQYGEFDRSEVLRFALDNGFPDVTAAFKAMQFDTVQAELARRNEESKRVQAKREAQVVSQGGSRSGSVSSQAPEGGMTIRDAWLAAKREHGG
jgi:hypothetical protein